MAQHDQVLANNAGATFRADANSALAALFSNSSGATEPTTMVAYQLWADTTTGLLKIRNAANSAWVTVGTLADANLGLAALAGSASQPFSASNFTTAQGIQFPATQNPSSDPNNLDDYEKGSYTPSIGGTLTVVGTPTYTGDYVKIGQLTTLVATFSSTTSISTSGRTVAWFSAPFTPLSGVGGLGVGNWVNFGTNVDLGNNTFNLTGAYFPQLSAQSDVMCQLSFIAAN